MTDTRMATAAELAEVGRRYSERRRLPIYVPGWYEQDIPTLLAHIDYLHGLLGRAGELLGEPCTMEAIQEQRGVAQTIDALLTEHGRREGE